MEPREMTQRSQATGQWHTRTLPMRNLPLLLWSLEERHVPATGSTPDALPDDAHQETP